MWSVGWPRQRFYIVLGPAIRATFSPRQNAQLAKLRKVRHGFAGQKVKSGYCHLQMLFLRVFDFVVAYTAYRLNEHHDRGDAGGGDLCGVVQRT